MSARRKRYKVWHMPGSSDTPGEAHFGLSGPRVNVLAVSADLARAMEQALNASIFTPREWKVIRHALATALASEHDWTPADVAAAQAIIDTWSDT